MHCSELGTRPFLTFEAFLASVGVISSQSNDAGILRCYEIIRLSSLFPSLTLERHPPSRMASGKSKEHVQIRFDGKEAHFFCTMYRTVSRLNAINLFSLRAVRQQEETGQSHPERKPSSVTWPRYLRSFARTHPTHRRGDLPGQ